MGIPGWIVKGSIIMTVGGLLMFYQNCSQRSLETSLASSQFDANVLASSAEVECDASAVALVEAENGRTYGWLPNANNGTGVSCYVSGDGGPVNPLPDDGVGGNGRNLNDAFMVVKPANYGTGNLLDQSRMGDADMPPIQTSSESIFTRFQSRTFGDFLYSSNEFRTWDDAGENRVVPVWNMTSTISSSAPFVTYAYNFGSRDARLGTERSLGNPNFLMNDDFSAVYFYATAAYPEVCYGIKHSDGSNPNSTPAQSPNIANLALPASVGNLPDFVINYNFSSQENAMGGNGFDFQGQTYYQERNIAIESFFHNDCSGNNVNKNTEVYEIMLWFAEGPERTPDGPNSYAGDVTIDGRSYEVWTKDRGGPGYIAFVDRNPPSPNYSGTVNWSLFVDWVRNFGHRVSEVFNKPNLFDQPILQNNICMSNILFGQEIWWGSGELRLNQWDISAFQKQ